MTVYNGTRKGLNVTVIGNPTINGTVVSGFSETNYVRTPEPLPTINYLYRFAVQLSVVFTNPSTITEIISGDETTFLLRANKKKLCFFASSNGKSWDIADQVYGTYALQAGVKYYITVQLEHGVVSVLIRAEGEPVSTRDISITFTTKKPDLSGKYIYFGWFNRKYFPGLTVDLKDCYYQIRYTTQWRAYDDMPRKIEDIYYSGPKKYWKEITTSTETEIVEGTKEDHTYSEPDVKQILSIHKPTTGNIPNVTVVGSPTIADNVVSGFSSSNYLTAPEVFNPGTSPWEMVWSITTSNDFSTTYQEIFAQANVGTAAVDGYDLRTDLGRIGLYVDEEYYLSATTLQNNTKYLIKMEYTGSFYKLSYSTDNGTNWTEDFNIASTGIGTPNLSTPQYIGKWGYNRSPDPFKGSIDLSQSYIKINGKYWWKGTKAGYDLLYNKNISLLKAEDFNSIKESSSGVAIWGGDATSTGGMQNPNQRDSITFNKSLPAGKYTVTFNYYSQVNFRMRLVQFTATYEDGTTEVVYSNTSLGDTTYEGSEKADVTTTMTFNKRIKGITTLAQGSGSGGGNGCYGSFGKVRMSLSGAQQ